MRGAIFVGMMRAPREVVRWSVPPCLTVLLLGAAVVLGVVFSPLMSSAAAAEVRGTTVPDSDSVRVLEFAGRVEYSQGGVGAWLPVRTNQVLVPTDRVRTGPASRATFQFSDRSVFRLNQSSQLEIRPVQRESGVRGLFLWVGELFFLDRERPARIEIRTPTTTSAIRGTEFWMGVDGEETVRLAVVEGVVSLASAGVEVEVASRQEATARSGRVPEVRPLLEVRSRLQWCLHYPGVVALQDLDLARTLEEDRRWVEVLAAYRSGDLLSALARVPAAGDVGGSQETRLLEAALRLAVGQVAAAEGVIAGTGLGHPVARALARVIAVVRGEAPPLLPEPSTASEWLARSYELQARSELGAALEAVRAAQSLAPDSGFVLVRRAELEWAFGRRESALAALESGRRISPGNPMGEVLAGFIEIADGRTEEAGRHFAEARRIDGSLADAWLGAGLVAARRGDREGALEALQAAAALEPTRSLLRSYLGKGWAAAGDGIRAAREFDLAIDLDPDDPTGWYYRGLERQQTHRLNESVDDLRKAIARNDGRDVFRSGLLLDQDRSMRQADLSVTYGTLGLVEVAERSASRAIVDDYGDFAAHLYRARTLQRYREDPGRHELRYEAARQNHLLVANLLAPVEGANLSQQLSQQDRLRPFDGGLVHGSSLTQYRSGGDWVQSGTVYGTASGFAYAVDGAYESVQADGAARPREEGGVSVTLKQAVGVRDDLYFQAGMTWREGGDPSRYRDPAEASPGFQFEETQIPYTHLGWHREWGPGSHTLALASYLEDELEITHPSSPLYRLRMRSGEPREIGMEDFFNRHLESRFRLGSIELQQIHETERHGVIVGARYQRGQFDQSERIRRVSSIIPVPRSQPGYEDAGAYAYYTLRPWRSLRMVAGVAYDDMRYPANVDVAPVAGGERERSQWSPKAGVGWTPWRGGQFRAAYTRSLGGRDYAQSLRLEPVEVVGFTQAYRNLAPVSVVGLLTGLPQDVVGVGFDQEFETRTFAGVSMERLTTEGRREVGAVRNSGFSLVPNQAMSLEQDVEYREQTLSAYVNQLLGSRWVAGARYSISRSEYELGYPELPAGLGGLPDVVRDDEAVLGRLELMAGFNHESGFYAQWASVFHHQQTVASVLKMPDESFWQHDVWVGYRFPRRRAEIRLGVLNLLDEDFRLNPMNEYRPVPRERTFEATLRINF